MMNNKLFLLCFLSLVSVKSVVAENCIEKALNLVVLPTDTTIVAEVREIHLDTFAKVAACDYEGALALTLAGLEKFPHSFALQADVAALLGDYAQTQIPAEDPIQNCMLKKSKDMFNKLVNEVDGQAKPVIYHFKNEYYYRFAHYKDQYELGVKRVDDYCGRDDYLLFGGYYSQGVGAANYAKELLKQGNKELAMVWAQKAVVAWAQYFSYRNDYYNAYVHYALALGVLGYEVEMMRALERSARLIGRDLTYFEFKDVIEFIDVHAEKN